MVRSQFVVVSDDQALIQKAQQFGQMHGVTVQLMSNEQWESLNNPTSSQVPSLVPGQGTFETGKVLPFPGQSVHGLSSIEQRRGVATINQLEATAIENAIATFKGNLTEAAKALGIGRATLYRKVKQYNIDPSVARNRKKAA
jgi:transcriptional regulator of acetoin/glycerol metabolism